MTNRTTRVSLVAEVSGYIQGMNNSARATRSVGTEAEQLAKKLEQQKQAAEQFGKGFLVAGGVLATGLALAVAKSSEFEQSMSEVQAATHGTAEAQAQLSAAAMKAGADTVFSATEAAQAELELAKAGVSTADVLGGALAGSMSLASAGGLGVADAAEIAATALTQFGLKGSDVPHVADLLAAGAGKAQGSVEDLSQALNQGGLVASQAGQTIEDTTGVLAAFASAGLIGSDAGTSLKTALLALESPSSTAKKVLDEYGISVYDANGNMLNFAGIAGQLQSKLGGLTAEQRNSALATIFGTDAVRSASILYEQGADGITEWTNKVNDSGYAAETARAKLDNLRGDIEYLQGAIDTGLIESGSAANDTLRAVVQTVTNAINVFDEAPRPVQEAALAFVALGAGVGLLGGAFLLGVPKVAAYRASLELVAETMPRVATAAKVASVSLGLIGIAMAAATTVAAVFVQQQADADGRVQSLTDSLDQQTGALTDNTRAVAVKQLTDKGAFEVAKGLGVSLDVVTDAALGNKEAIAELAKEQAAYDAKIKNLDGTFAAGGGFKILQEKIGDTSGEVGKATEKFKDNQEAMATSTTESGKAAGAYAETAAKAKDLTDQLSALVDEVNKANGVGQDAVTTNASYKKALGDAAETIDKAKNGIEGYSLSLDGSTESGSANQSMLADLAKAGQDAATAQYDLDHNTQTYRDSLQAVHDNIYEQAKAFGVSDDAAADLADQIAVIPAESIWTAIAETSDAQKKVDAFNAAVQLAKANPVVNVTMTTDQITRHIEQQYGSGELLKVPAYASGGTVGSLLPQFASGGTAFGPGTAKSDSIPVRLSVGEEVIQMPYAAKYRNELKQMNAGAYQSPQHYQYANNQSSISAADIARELGKVMAGQAQKNVTMNVHPAPGMSENTVAEIAANKINRMLRLP